ncbi:hypothetical protein EN871_10730 [bacterium M00.F.Ca.ET.228.01.1.1]|uniref:hypothetical protein n=1 Tax=Paraburkholderia phenoliruptrix TaxID=252970 RepID=UPI00109234E8|nr:hypothetical protein [Paraburkholderia phenoliruptrix]TGP45036.1 hypothetical protein EN871_10730 [bacterium M00.F.Ca.ET.228.01.1.1]TGS02919.1 hypothetical protein EN834_10725 [bacterium M00.F.Ca.ET.191.01.1.1]TGU06301.1 hypothetical protein EN798_14805 [bacterium M00.F.Ca.ET.155.01.1.1]MBW0448910.1 hypothetical protein [Paraburkholderia phenoliruptrix]MBW9097887.1 hypothetical protein [Paraburkholderia phenoliruptrix]
MSYWRKLILVLLLALSLPVQSFAAVSMMCAPSEAEGDEPAASHLHLAGSVDQDSLVADIDGHEGHHHDLGPDSGHHPHACLACASCCVGAALPVVPVVSASTDLIQFSAPLPPDAGVVLFLTGGIERPPRLILV